MNRLPYYRRAFSWYLLAMGHPSPWTERRPRPIPAGVETGQEFFLIFSDTPAAGSCMGTTAGTNFAPTASTAA